MRFSGRWLQADFDTGRQEKFRFPEAGCRKPARFAARKARHPLSGITKYLFPFSSLSGCALTVLLR
jgi:hypothetical protein